MSQKSSQNRKFSYLLGILVLLIPIIGLGMPASRGNAATGAKGTSGLLSQMRERYDLGDSDLGDVDPSSSAMNLVLLGLRGVAANVLWQQADEAKDHKDWSTMRAVTESIVKLQPHFVKVWDFLGWNLAYNVSAEWDDVRDRYYWVKEGGQFLKQGVDRNVRTPDLYWYVGRIYGQKIGLSDEARYFRRIFNPEAYSVKDLNEYFRDTEMQNDSDFNPDRKDNYLVAKDWFTKANDAERGGVKQNVSVASGSGRTFMDRSLFRSYPARSQLDYATALQADGVFGEKTREAWAESYEDWTQKYGKDEMPIMARLEQNSDKETPLIIWMEMSEEDVAEKARSVGADPEAVGGWLDQYQKIVNYRWWRTRTLAEREVLTSSGRREIFEAGEKFRESELNEAKTLVESGMAKLAEAEQKYPELFVDGDLVETCLMAVILRSSCYRLLEEAAPSNYPLADLWSRSQQSQDLDRVNRDFEKNYLRR